MLDQPAQSAAPVGAAHPRLVDRASGRIGLGRRRAIELESAVMGRLDGLGVHRLDVEAVVADLSDTVAPKVCIESYWRWRVRYERAMSLRARRAGEPTPWIYSR